MPLTASPTDAIVCVAQIAGTRANLRPRFIADRTRPALPGEPLPIPRSSTVAAEDFDDAVPRSLIAPPPSARPTRVQYGIGQRVIAIRRGARAWTHSFRLLNSPSFLASNDGVLAPGLSVCPAPQQIIARNGRRNYCNGTAIECPPGFCQEGCLCDTGDPHLGRRSFVCEVWLRKGG
jgi:hypothetical protein